MIQSGSKCKVVCNSGGREAECIKVLGGSRKRYARVGDTIRVSVQQAIPAGKVRKSEVLFAIVVRTRKAIKRAGGITIRFDSNAAVLLNKQRQLIGTRVAGPVPRDELRGFKKLLSLAELVI